MKISDFGMRLAVIALIGLSLSACAGMGTVVDENDPETELPNVSMGRAIFEGLGAVPARRTPINYSPRAPLVFPRDTNTLKPPEDPNQVANMSDWPEDPDVASAKRLRDAAARDAKRERGDLIGSSELMAERLPPNETRTGARPAKEKDTAKPLMSKQLEGPRSIDGSTGVYDETGTPRRRALVEPPVAYLQPAPGAPVAIPEETSSKKGFFSWLKW